MFAEPSAWPPAPVDVDRAVPEDRPLELSPARFTEMVHAVTARLAAHLATLDEQPMHRNRGAEKKARELREPLPHEGTSFESVLRHVFDRVLPPGLNTASPGYLAYIPGGGLPHAAVADLVTSTVNRFVNLWMAAPGLVEIEASVVRWFLEIVGLPRDTGGGVLTTGGSIANLVALVAARRARLPESFLEGTIYCSAETHHSITKAALIAGFPVRNVRKVASDVLAGMSITDLEDQLGRDRAAGLTPFCVVGNAGTTTAGTVDPLDDIATVAQREGLWFHADAAYGGFFAMTERGKIALRGIERADSVTLDPHKGLFLPYGTGSLLVRDRATLKRAFSASAAYLPPMQTDDDLIDFCELSPELSREARGLRVYLPFKMHGAAAFRAALDEKLDLARYAAAEVAAIEGVVLVSPPALSLFTFRLEPEGRDLDAARLNALQKRVIHFVNQKQRVLLTGGDLDGRFVIRVCVLSFRTHREHMEKAVADICAAVAEALGELSS